MSDNLSMEKGADIISRLRDVGVHIFSRLPAESIFLCKQVCKTWKCIIVLLLKDKKFAEIHMENYVAAGAGSNQVNQGLVFLVKSVCASTGHPLYFGGCDENNGTDLKPVKINHPLIPTKMERDTDLLVGSCNGLICVSEPRIGHLRDPAYICNPITRECLNLPGINRKNEFGYAAGIFSGFGIDSQTNEYKVVRIMWCTVKAFIQVYTLGSGNGWRFKGEMVMTNVFDSSYGVFANGTLHWVDRYKNKILAFNLSDEEFHILPSLEMFFFPYYDRFSFLRSAGECLCAIGFTDTCLDVWTFKKKKTSPEGITDTTTATTTTDNVYDSWSWCMEFSVTPNDRQPRPWYYKTVALTKTGSILLSSHNKKFYCYKPKMKTLESLGDLKFLEVIPHTNSFVSLKDLGETTSKKRKMGETARK